MAQVKQDKTNLTEDKKVAGELHDGTIQRYGTPPKRSNGMRSEKLLRNTMRIYPEKPKNKI